MKYPLCCRAIIVYEANMVAESQIGTAVDQTFTKW